MVFLRTITTASFLALASSLFTSPGLAQEKVPGPWGELVDHVKPLNIRSDRDRITHFRRQKMRAQSAHFRAIEAVVIYDAPFKNGMADDARALQVLARRMDDWFVPGTALDGGKFGAKPEIWQQQEKFSQHIDGYRKAVDELVAASVSGGDLRPAFIGVRHQCLACHQSFRVFEGRP